MKLALIILLPMLCVGCASPAPKINTEYREVITPVSNIPQPPNTDCPTDAVASISNVSGMSDGEVAKAYRIAVLQLRDCSLLRQRVLDKYREMAIEDGDRIADIKDATPTGPFSMSGPNNPSSVDAPIIRISPTEIQRQLKADDDFRKLSSEFDNLNKKTYEIE